MSFGGKLNKVEDSDLTEALKLLLNPSKLDGLIACAVGHDAPCEGGGPKTALLHVRFQEDEPQVTALAEYLWSQCMYYALPRRKRLEYQELISNDFAALTRVYKAVRDIFIAFNNQYPSRASEVGEVLAYCVTQQYLSAAQVAAKMALKTSPNMPVHGLDGVHAAFENGALTIYFLESKLAGSAASGIKDFTESAGTFLKNPKQYHREYQIVSDLGHFDSLEGPARKAALDYFDIIGKPDLPRRERSVGVICHSESKHFGNKIPVSDGAVELHEAHFASLYQGEHAKRRALANKHLQTADANPAKVLLFLVAVPDVNVLRKAFYQAMGVEDTGEPILDTDNEVVQ